MQSIADCTGTPRETVRRKVRFLEALGWIQRPESGMLQVSRQAAQDPTPATDATFRHLVAVGSACVDAAGQE